MATYQPIMDESLQQLLPAFRELESHGYITFSFNDDGSITVRPAVESPLHFSDVDRTEHQRTVA